MTRHAIVLFGLPASGKSTIGKFLSMRLNAPFLKIEDSWDQAFLEPTYTVQEANAVFELFLERVLRHAGTQAERLILEAVLSKELRVSRLRELFLQKKIPVTFVLLTASLSTLLARLDERKRMSSRGPRVMSSSTLIRIAAEMDSTLSADLIIDTDSHTVHHVVETILHHQPASKMA